jgi:hypothetical protein
VHRLVTIPSTKNKLCFPILHHVSRLGWETEQSYSTAALTNPSSPRPPLSLPYQTTCDPQVPHQTNHSARIPGTRLPPPPQTLAQTGMHSTRTKQKTKTDLYMFIITASHVLFSQATGRVLSSSPNTAIVDEVGAGTDAGGCLYVRG